MKVELCVLIIFLRCIYAKTSLRIVLLTEAEQSETAGWFSDMLKEEKAKLTNYDISEDTVTLLRADESGSLDKLCKSVNEGVSLLLDASWTDWPSSTLLMERWSVPYAKIEIGSAILILQPVLELLKAKNATDVVFIFQSEMDLDQCLYNIISKSILRVLVMTGESENRIADLKNLRPIPGHFVIIGTTNFIQDTYKLMKKNDMVRQSDRWILAFTDLESDRLDSSILGNFTTLLTMTKSVGCGLIDADEYCNLEKDINIQYPLMQRFVQEMLKASLEMNKNQQFNPIKVDCAGDASSVVNYTNTLPNQMFKDILQKNLNTQKSLFYWDLESKTVTLRGSYELQIGDENSMETVAKWQSGEQFKTNYGVKIKPIRRFLRIGTTPSIPWTYPKLDPETGEPLKTDRGQPIYEGYCIDLIAKLSEKMDFDYEIITPKSGSYGKKFPNGTWNGIIGDLVSGDTDMAVAATMMTSEREEVIDFVAPYYEESGITIAMRKPVAKTSLFRFMTVLRLEVWLSIIAALTLTAMMLSIMDRYSPYSARNNRTAYPYPCREFTLKESFWFALTSFTPQGGGEAPKSLSGRTLVAAYWLFVVLMLSTFTANLAAFLTVERMTAPVSSLEQLARQSRINYTVVAGSPTHAYFTNMKNAEDTIYRVWKEITLNSTSDETIYQVWDYPIKEQYGRIMLAINSAGLVANETEGFQRVYENEDSDFAFLHDSSVIKYEVSRNCNIIEIGENFGVRPYAIAVQQGSRIQEEISVALIEMQTDRFMESLREKHWNSSAKGVCPDGDEEEGISLRSLGGVFIATLCGLGLAMVCLVWEMIYHKRQDMKVKSESTEKIKDKKIDKPIKRFRIKRIHKGDIFKRNITFGDTFKPVSEKKKSNVSYINVEPKIAWNP